MINVFPVKIQMSKKRRVERVVADGTTDVRTSPSEDICHAKDGAGAEDICNGQGAEKAVNDVIPAQCDSDFIVRGYVSGISSEPGECVETAINCLGSGQESNFTAAMEVSDISSGPTECPEKAVNDLIPAQYESHFVVPSNVSGISSERGECVEPAISCLGSGPESNFTAAREVSDISSGPTECAEKAVHALNTAQLETNFIASREVSGISSEPAEHVNITWSSECTVVTEAEMVPPFMNVQERCDQHALENTPIVRANGCVAVDEESSIPMEGELQLHTRSTKKCARSVFCTIN